MTDEHFQRRDPRYPVPESLSVNAVLKDTGNNVLARGSPIDVSREGTAVVLEDGNPWRGQEGNLEERIASVVFTTSQGEEIEVLARARYVREEEGSLSSLRIGLEFFDWPPFWLLKRLQDAAKANSP